MSEYRKPTMPGISRSNGTNRLYELEEAHKIAFRAAAEELGKVLEFTPAQFWTHTMPEAIASFLESYDTHAVRLACETWLEAHQD